MYGAEPRKRTWLRQTAWRRDITNVSATIHEHETQLPNMVHSVNFTLGILMYFGSLALPTAIDCQISFPRQ